MKLLEIVHGISASDQIKHYIDLGISAAIGGSFVAWMNLWVPEITMIATCISAVLGAAWFIYRWHYAIKFHSKRNRRKEDSPLMTELTIEDEYGSD